MSKERELETQFFDSLRRRSVDEGLIQRIQFKLEETRWCGESMGENLEKLLDGIGFDPQFISTNGVISFDVYFGTEIVAMRRFNPSRLIVTENPGRSSDDLPYCDELALDDHKREIIEILGAGGTFQYLDCPVKEALSRLQLARTQGIGLVTWLNVWPARLHNNLVKEFLEETFRFLSLGGLVLVSASCTEDKARAIFDQIAQEDNCGNLIESFVTNEYQDLGRYFLTLKKMAKGYRPKIFFI